MDTPQFSDGSEFPVDDYVTVITKEELPSIPIGKSNRWSWKSFLNSMKNYNLPKEPELIEGKPLQDKLDEIDALLKDGKTPSREATYLELSYKKFKCNDVLMNLDLRSANLRGADLKGHKFGWANVADADFSDADLTDADLSIVENLQAHQLSGADLNRCKLPDTIADFPQLENVAELSKNAGRLFSTMIGGVIFMLLITFTTPDLQILAASGKAKLPIIDLEVSTTTFLIVSPAVLLIVYVLVHLYLQRLWAMMSQLPAIFPDGVPVDAKTYPWLVNDRIRLGFQRLNTRPTPFAWLHVVTFGSIVYSTVPVAILLVYLRCLIRHDWLTTDWQIGLLAICGGACVMFVGLNRITLNRYQVIVDQQGNWRRKRYGVVGGAIGLITNLLLACFLYNFAKCAFYGVPDLQGVYYTDKAKELLNSRKMGQLNEDNRRAKVSKLGYIFVPRLLHDLHLTSYGNIPEDRTLRPEKWNDPINSFIYESKKHSYYDDPYGYLQKKDFFINESNEIENGNQTVIGNLKNLSRKRIQRQIENINLQVKPINLRDMHLNFLNAPSAFLLNADLRGAQLQFANLNNADLRGIQSSDDYKSVNLSGANLENAILTGADLRFSILLGADLYKATLTGANLNKSNLVGAELSQATLHGTDLSESDLTSANLFGAMLQGADLGNATLIDSELSDATMTDARLVQAKLINAGLVQTKLVGAMLIQADMTGANLTEAILYEANLEGSILKRAHIVEANLEKADMTRANLSEAQMLNVNMAKSLLIDANLTDAKIYNVNLDEVVFSFSPNKAKAFPGTYTIWPNRNGDVPEGYEVVPVPISRLVELGYRSPDMQKQAAGKLRMLIRTKNGRSNSPWRFRM